MTKLTESYQDYLLERLQDPEEAAAYLNAVIEENDDRVFSLALQNVAEAQRMAKSATMADLNPKQVNQIKLAFSQTSQHPIKSCSGQCHLI